MAKGAAILAVGHGLADATAALTSLVAQIGETLLATAGGWKVRRLSPLTGERDGVDRASLKRCLGELCEGDADTIVLALAGVVVEHDGEPCLVTGPDAAKFPEDATLPLAWITERLRSCVADRVVVVASLEGPAADSWRDAFATGRPRHVVVCERSEGRARGLLAFLAAVRGAAIDPHTGTVTLRSLGEYLQRTVGAARFQLSDESETLASSPPLAGPWDARLTSKPGPRDATPEDVIDTVLPGRFKILRELARGSFGNVYVAHQLAVDRDVAVKVLHGAVAPGSEVGRLFVHEIQSVGRIDHPNVVRIFQADITAAGSLFYAMELLAGQDLQQIVEQGVVDKARAIALGRQLASALAAAHEVGLVHADVKPANAMVVPGKPDERLVLLDFGLARLRTAEGTQSAGGTLAYMAPEQLRDGRVDARSDVFSAALTLVTLLTGWRRQSADQLVPPLDSITDPMLRGVLAKALAVQPADRYQHGGELATALGETAIAITATLVPPFRLLAPFTEADRDRLYGRDAEIATLVEHALFRRAVVYTAPSGTGKTSLLRAGLVPRLATLGLACVYVACHGDEPPDLARAIWPEGDTPAIAAAARILTEHKRLVVIVDQIEAALGNEAFAAQLRELERAGAELELGIVLSVREDVLASLLARLDTQASVLRLGPLTPDGASEAIVGPLIERRVTIEEPALAALIADLERAARLLAGELRWTAGRAVYPPHLQLACTALFEQLGPGEEVLTLKHYEKLGGLDEIIRDYLDRVLETELPEELIATARRVLLALVASDRTRAVRTDAELAEQLADDAQLARVLEVLRQRGVIVPLRSASGQPAWELVHDSLVPRVLAWSDRADLARQRALEIVRHHLRGKSLLSRAELREVMPHADALEELDRERRAATPRKARELVALSRRSIRDRWIVLALSIAVALGAAGFLGLRWFEEREARLHEQVLVQLDVGTFVLELAPFDWDPVAQRATPVAAGELTLAWTLVEPDPADPLSPSDKAVAVESTRLPTPARPWLAQWQVQTRGGRGVLIVTGRGRNGQACGASIVPLQRLPGHAMHGEIVHVRIPTCQATWSDEITIPAGKYISGGVGDLHLDLAPLNLSPAYLVETERDLPTYAIDRTEVTNAAYRLAFMDHGEFSVPHYPVDGVNMERADSPRAPIGFVNWFTARAYCRFLGKDLPSTWEWEKALRGGLTLPNGAANPNPRRNYPWGTPDSRPANVDGMRGGPHLIDEDRDDVSPYGVTDLGGNMYEWTTTTNKPGTYTVRSAGYDLPKDDLALALLFNENPREATFTAYPQGMRCADESPRRDTR